MTMKWYSSPGVHTLGVNADRARGPAAFLNRQNPSCSRVPDLFAIRAQLFSDNRFVFRAS